MWRILLICLFPISLYSQQASLRVMSFNLRLHLENAWPHQTKMVESVVRFHQADLIGVQEALEGQMVDLRKMLPDFSIHGAAKDTGQWAEYSAIWYRTSRLDLLEGSTFWLSETPELPSKGWDAALNRIASWAIFRDKQTGQRFFHLNTHLDPLGKVARRESARLILQKLEELNPETLPVIVTGDFNAIPSSEPYQVLTHSTEFLPLLDAWQSSLTPVHAPTSTWNGFDSPGEADRRIDYVFTQYQVAVLRCAALTESWSGRFPSDHLPVLAEVLISPTPALTQAHAHNDYEHDRPFFDALTHGFTSVEADVWLLDGELYVSHNKPSKLSQDLTLRHLYLDPLAQLLSQGIGWVYPGYQVPFSLMIDLKNEGIASYEMIQEQLQPYRWMLEPKQGQSSPVMIFLSGDRPVDLMHKDPDRFVGIDGRPEHLGKGYSAEEMPVISQRYGKLISWRGNGEIPAKEFRILKTLSDQAHAEGKRVRLWASPEKENVWQTLLEAGIDLINTDELERLRIFLEKK